LGSAHIISPLSVTRAAARSASHIDLACSPDSDEVGTPFTRLLRYESGVWTTRDLKLHAESLCQYRGPDRRAALLVMSREGDVMDVDATGRHVLIEHAISDSGSIQSGFFYKLHQVGNSLFACGSAGRNFVKSYGGPWKILDPGLLDGEAKSANWLLEYLKNPDLMNNPAVAFELQDRIKKESSTIFWSIAGSDEAQVYLAGERGDGLLRLWDGRIMTVCELPTRKALRDIYIGPDGTVWICGREGLLLKGRDQNFDVVVDHGEQPRFSSMAWFNDRLFVGSSSGPGALFMFDDNKLRPVETGHTMPYADVHTLDEVGGVLWSVGMKGLARFDGKAWETIPVPGVTQ
jgi:hypothetical protein